MSKIFEFWKNILPEWRFAIGTFVLTRIVLSFWSLAVYWMFPISIQNLALFGEPILTVFNLQTGERYVYSRQLDDMVLSFHAKDTGYVVDDQTGSIWSLKNGEASQGDYVGKSLAISSHTAEDIFPYLGETPAKNMLLSLWQRFDANWYLKIASRGYGSGGSTVYFPIYPMFIRFLSGFIDPLFAAILISNLALIGCLVLLYRITTDIVGDNVIAGRTLIYFVIFPTSFFLMAPYTESLFTLFVLASLYSVSRRQFGWVVLWGILSALTRLQGVLLFAPLAYMIWRESRELSLKELILRITPLLTIPVATLGFLDASNLSLISTYQGTLHARFVLPWDNIFATISLLVNGNGSIIDALNLVITLGLIAMMFVIWKRLPFEYTIYSMLMLIAPMLRMTTTQPLVSMSRYAIVIFPVFIILGMWGGNRWVNRVIVYTSFSLQLYLSAQFILWGWVA